MMPLSVIYFTIQYILLLFLPAKHLSNPTEKFRNYCSIHLHTHAHPASGHPNGVFCDLRQWRDRRDNYRCFALQVFAMGHYALVMMLEWWAEDNGRRQHNARSL